MRQLKLDLQTPVFRGLLDSLHVAIETGDRAEANLVLAEAESCDFEHWITSEQYAELKADYNARF